MSDYEPFEAAQGDPWSTEPVGDAPRQNREPAPQDYPKESDVLARMPHVAEEGASDSYRNYRQGSGGSRRRRSQPRRPGVPAPVWIVVGMGLLALIAGPFLLSGNSGDEAAMQEPEVWQPEMPAPDADVAPKWSPESGDGTDPSWQQPGGWNQAASSQEPAAAVNAEPAAADAWNAGGDWVGAPANAPYAYNAGEAPGGQAPAQPYREQTGAAPSANSTVSPNSAPRWNSSESYAGGGSAPESNYSSDGFNGQSSYPMTAETPAPNWSGNGSEPAGMQQVAPHNREMQSGSTTGSWGQRSPSLATPQPENVMPGYGDYPAAQENPYVASPSHNDSSGYRGSYTGPPTSSGSRNASGDYAAQGQPYPAAPQGSGERYPKPSYPRTAMSPYRGSNADPAPGSGYGTQPPAQSATDYPAGTGDSYVPQSAPATRPRQPYYGSGASTDRSQRNVARLNGTIQDPAARTAYDDRARPSYY